MFLDFANFYKRFIKNFSRIVTSHILILQITSDEALRTQATKDERNEAISTGASGSGTSGGVGRSIKNLSIVTNLAKKSKLTKPKRSKLSNAKANSKNDFLFFKAKKTFSKVAIFKHFDLERHI